MANFGEMNDKFSGNLVMLDENGIFNDVSAYIRPYKASANGREIALNFLHMCIFVYAATLCTSKKAKILRRA